MRFALVPVRNNELSISKPLFRLVSEDTSRHSMFDRTNDFANPASNRTRKATVTYLRPPGTNLRGEVIMNGIQKAITAALALTITVCGAAFVTAPMTLADMQTAAFNQSASIAYVQQNSSIATSASRNG